MFDVSHPQPPCATPPDSRSAKNMRKDFTPSRPFAFSACCSIVGNASQRLGQWVILIVLAKLGSTETIGAYALGLAACNPLMMLSYLQLGSVLAADSTGRYPFTCYWRLRLSLCCMAAASVVGLTLVLGFRASEVSLIAVLAVAKVFEGLSDIRHGLLKKADRMDLLAATQLVRAAVTILVFSTFFSVTGNLFWSIFALAVGWAACLLLADLPLSRLVMEPTGQDSLKQYKPAPNQNSWKPLAISAIPLGLISLVISVYTYCPQYLLKVSCGEAKLGVFVAVASLPIVLETIARSVAQATIPRFAAFWASGDAASFKRLYRHSLVIFAALGCLGSSIAWCCGEFLLRGLFSPDIALHQPLLFVMTLAAASSFLCSYGSIFVALKQYAAFLRLWCWGLSLLAVLCLVLVPAHGMYGAAFSLLGSNLFRVALIHHFIYKLFREGSFTDGRKIPRSPEAEIARAA